MNENDTERGETMSREKLLARIRKLYAMSLETESSPHEAEIALRRCQALMAKFGIRESDLETSEFSEVRAHEAKRTPMHVKILAVAAAELHDCVFVTGARRDPEFRGFAIDAEVARLTLEYLSGAVERTLAQRKREGAVGAGRSPGFDYRVSFAKAVLKRVRVITAERKAKSNGAGTGTALVVRKLEIVNRECGRDTGRTTFRSPRARDQHAALAGRVDGENVSLERQVGAERPAAALPVAG